MFWVISVYFNIKNTLPKSGTFLLGHPVYIYIMSNNDGPEVRKTNKPQNTLKLIITKVLKLELKPTKVGGHYHEIDSENRAVKTHSPSFQFRRHLCSEGGGGG